MSVSNLSSLVSRLEHEIAEIHRKIAEETKNEINKLSQIDSVSRSINKNTSSSTVESKNRQISGYQKDILGIQRKKADLQKKLADKTKDVLKKRQELTNEEAKERKKAIDVQQRENERIRYENEALQRKLQDDLEQQKQLLNSLVTQDYSPRDLESDEIKKYDFFISHATEDKDEIVRPLAEKLLAEGIQVWYDEHQLTVGDSLRRKIDEGLRNSRFGIVVFSASFFAKNWPEYELNGLVAREMNGVKVVLPIWHKVSKDEVMNYSPGLVDKIALNTALYSIDEIVKELKKLLH